MANWDGFRSNPIPHDCWERAKSLFRFAEAWVPNLPQFVVSPCGDGSIHMRWDSPSGVTVVFEFGPNDLVWTSRDREGNWSEGRCATWSEATEILRQRFRV